VKGNPSTTVLGGRRKSLHRCEKEHQVRPYRGPDRIGLWSENPRTFGYGSRESSMQTPFLMLIRHAWRLYPSLIVWGGSNDKWNVWKRPRYQSTALTISAMHILLGLDASGVPSESKNTWSPWFVRQWKSVCGRVGFLAFVHLELRHTK
jgi:hypothetical protein